MHLPYFKVRGTPEETGKILGKNASSLIAHNLEIYFRRFRDEVGLPKDVVLARAKSYQPIIRKKAPEFWAIMKGISEGSGQSLEEILVLNVRYEILYSQYSSLGMEEQPPTRSTPECTAFAIGSKSSSDGRLRIGQNWDWIPDVKCILTEMEFSSGPRVLCLNEAGIAGGKIGLNSCGLGLVVNGLISNLDDWSRVGEPFHVLTWKVLRSQELEEAVSFLIKGEHPCSANFLIAQDDRQTGMEGTIQRKKPKPHPAPQGENMAQIVNVEIYPEGEVIRERTDIFVHANHFLKPEEIGIWEPFRKDSLSTFDRYSRMKELLESSKDSGIPREFLPEVLSDHVGKPDSICRHRNLALTESERFRTVLSVIMDLTSTAMKVAPGPPCEQPYSEYAISV